MTTGATHFKHNLATAGVVTAVALYLNEPISLVTAANVIGIMFTPDIDVEAKTFTEAKFGDAFSYLITKKKKSQQKVSRFISSLFQILTAPYAFIFAHRSWLTHLPPFSVVTQFLYFYLLYFCFCKILNLEYYSVEEIALFKDELIVIGAVLFAHHFVHLIGDGGMIMFLGKRRYFLSYPFYKLTTRLFPQGRD